MALDLETRATAGYPADLRGAAGIGITKRGLRADLALELRDVQKLDATPVGGLVPVQDPATGLVQALSFDQLPTASTGPGTQTNVKLAPMPALTVKGNTTGANAQPQDVALSLIASTGNPIGDAIALKAANLYRQIAFGAVDLTVPQVLDLVSSPKKFGAIADGASHPLSTRFASLALAQAFYTGVPITALTQEIDWAACQAAANAALMIDYGIGSYYMGTGTVVTANRPVCHRFAGVGATKFTFTGVNMVGFLHTDTRTGGAGAGQRGTFLVPVAASFVTTVAGGGSVFKVDMRNPSAVLASAVYGGPPSVYIETPVMYGDDDFAGQGQHYWTRGVHLIDTGTALVRGPVMLGAYTKPGTVGVLIENATGANTEFFITNPCFKYVEKYVEIVPNSRTIEGVYILQPSCVGARVAVDVHGGIVYSLEVSGGHMDAKEAILKGDSTTRNSDAWLVHDCYLQLSNQYDGTYAAGAKMFDFDGLLKPKITHNHLVSFDPSKTQIGVNGAGVDRASVDGNTFINFAKATTWPANSVSTAATNNRVSGTNQYIGNTIITDDPVAGSTNYIERTGTRWAERANGEEIRFGTVSVTLDGSGAGSIPFAKQMRRAPDVIRVNNASFTAGTLSSAFVFNAASATVDSFVMAVSPNPGAITVTVSYEAIARAPTPN